jgi:AcrR family transcriptional regulator
MATTHGLAGDAGRVTYLLRSSTRKGLMPVASSGTQTQPRLPLSRARVLAAAIKVADEGGLGALTMRRLADELGAEAMSLYYHVANKDDVLDGMVDSVVSEINDVVGRIDLPATGANWKNAVRRRILAARQVLLRHPWAPPALQSRTTVSMAVLRCHDELVRLMREGGSSADVVHHACTRSAAGPWASCKSS